MKNTPKDIIILLMCTINDNHMMYGSWDIKRNRQIFCHFGPFFALLHPYQPKKSKFWKHEKTACRYYYFTHVYHKWQSWCMVPEIWSVTDRIFCHFVFWTIFCLFTIVHRGIQSPTCKNTVPPKEPIPTLNNIT